ncbi:unnamed protein product [Lactuca virosa]|uniref:Uncharacterized protein n=1 Tax=Lactuca virosa TaxID=75947 RepID=A0AAU9LHB2_9ASTR|nr:unnamed protein product [Lactuca virosa]
MNMSKLNRSFFIFNLIESVNTKYTFYCVRSLSSVTIIPKKPFTTHCLLHRLHCLLMPENKLLQRKKVTNKPPIY